MSAPANLDLGTAKAFPPRDPERFGLSLIWAVGFSATTLMLLAALV